MARRNLLALLLVVGATSTEALHAPPWARPPEPHGTGHHGRRNKSAVDTRSLALTGQNASCGCRNWRGVYETGDAVCGQASEFFLLLHSHSPKVDGDWQLAEKFLGKLLCEEFLHRFDSTRCLNVNWGMDNGTWCYVDEGCGHLNGGYKLFNASASWKNCGPEDSKLGDLPPEELYNYTRVHDLWMAVALKLAYPGSRAGEKSVMDPSVFLNGIATWMVNYGPEFQEVVGSGEPYWFDTRLDGERPQVIVHGERAYMVNESASPDRNESHPGTRDSFACVSGCGGEVARVLQALHKNSSGGAGAVAEESK